MTQCAQIVINIAVYGFTFYATTCAEKWNHQLVVATTGAFTLTSVIILKEIAMKLMPRLHLPRTSYDLFVYDFLYHFFGIVGGYKLRRVCLHCLRSPYDFFRRQTRTKPYRDLAKHRFIYINRTMPARRPCGGRKVSVR